MHYECMDTRALGRRAGPPLVEICCVYEVVALHARGSRFERRIPTLSVMLHNHRHWRKPVFWVGVGMTAWLLHHLWLEKDILEVIRLVEGPVLKTGNA